MYGLEENEEVQKGKVICVWSPVHRQGAVSANAALVASYLAVCSSGNTEEKRVLVMSNEMSFNLQASKYLTSNNITDRLSTVCMMSKSGNLNTPEDLVPHTENIGDNLDVIGPTFKDKTLVTDIVSEIENILAVARLAYDYIVIDTSSGVWNASSKRIIDTADVVLVCLPQDKYTIAKYREEDEDVYSNILKGKAIIHISSLHYEYEHFTLGSIRRIIGSKVYPISLNDQVNKALYNRNVFEFISKEFKKRKKYDDVLEELEELVEEILRI